MAMQCLICHKGVQYGHNVSHSKRRTVRTFKPNLHSAKVVVNGQAKRVKLCTKCLRMYKRTSEAMVEIEAEQPATSEVVA
jgi:large subunit ribosomal protein L28